MILTKMKGYLIAGWSLLLSLGTFLLTLSVTRSRQRKKDNEILKARMKHQKDVMIADKEFEQEHDKRTEDLRDQVEKDGVSDELSNPNEW